MSRAEIELQEEIATLEAERQRLKAAIKVANKDVIASLHCPTTTEEFYLTRAEFAAALDRLDSLSSLSQAGPSNEMSAWSLGGYGVKEAAAHFTSAAIEVVVPLRLRCPKAHTAIVSEPANTVQIDQWRVQLFDAEEALSATGPIDDHKDHLYCIGPSASSDQQWPHQCVTGHEAVRLYLFAVNEAPKVAAMLGLQMAVTVCALLLSLHLLRGAYKSFRLDLRRRKTIADTAGSRLERDIVGQPAHINQMRRDQDTIAGVLRWASLKMYFAMLLLFVIPTLSMWLSWQAESKESYSLVPLVMKGISFLTGSGTAETVSSVAATLVLVKLVGVPLVGSAVHIMTKATSDLKAKSFREALRRMRETTLRSVEVQNSPIRRSPTLQGASTLAIAR